MTLEKQVCSLELAKRLKKLGVVQKSYFYWVDASEWFKSPYKRKGKIDPVIFGSAEHNPKAIIASAFTVAELGELLPHLVGAEDLKTERTNRGWVTKYGTSGKYYESADTEANARAKMLIHLKEKEKT